MLLSGLGFRRVSALATAPLLAWAGFESAVGILGGPAVETDGINGRGGRLVAGAGGNDGRRGRLAVGLAEAGGSAGRGGALKGRALEGMSPGVPGLVVCASPTGRPAAIVGGDLAGRVAGATPPECTHDALTKGTTLILCRCNPATTGNSI
jgi:hypothetical protein